MISIWHPEAPDKAESRGWYCVRTVLYGVVLESLVCAGAMFSGFTQSAVEKQIDKLVAPIDRTPIRIVSPDGLTLPKTNVLIVREPIAVRQQVVGVERTTRPRVTIDFASDPHQDLADALTRYGGTLAFGKAAVAVYRFAGPNWGEVLPRQSVLVTNGFFPIVINDVRSDSFVGRVKAAITDEPDPATLEAYALFPAAFQDLLEAELLDAAPRKCAQSSVIRGVVAFSREVKSYVRIIDVVCQFTAAGAQP